MAKWMNDAGADAALAYWSDADQLSLCSAQPTTYAEASSTYELAVATPSYTGPANGDVSGRKIASDAKTGVSVAVSGTVTHAALSKSGDTTLRYVTTTASQAVASGGTVDIGTFDIEIEDPA